MRERTAFPNWLKRLDPTLAKAEQTPAYEAFRLRRTTHAAADLGRWLKHLTAWKVLVACGWALGSLAGVAAFLFFGCAAVPAIILAGVVASTAFQRISLDADAMPRRIGDVFGTTGFLKHAAIDLWLAGVGGRDVLLAIYGERRENRGMVHGLVIASIAVPLVVACAGMAGEYPVGTTVLCLSIIWLAVESWLFFVVASGDSVRRRHIESRILVWQKGSAAAGHLALRNTGRLFGWLLSSSFFFFPFLALLLIVALMILNADPATLPASPWSVAAVSLAAIIGLVAAGLHAFRSDQVQGLARENENILQGADAAFERFMASTVAGDPDGAAWAAWVARQRLGTPESASPATAGAAPPPLPAPQ